MQLFRRKGALMKTLFIGPCAHAREALARVQYQRRCCGNVAASGVRCLIRLGGHTLCAQSALPENNADCKSSAVGGAGAGMEDSEHGSAPAAVSSSSSPRDPSHGAVSLARSARRIFRASLPYKDLSLTPKTVGLAAMQRRPTGRAVAGRASRRAPGDPAAPTDPRLGRRTRRSAALTS